MLTLHNSTSAIAKKIFTVQIVALASISTLVVSSSSSAWGQSQLIALRQCKNVDGKVMSPGDRYLEAGLPNEALSEYTTAKKLYQINMKLHRKGLLK